ncbi:MAG: hypothetical protein IIZ06_03625 [Kiritimatiellae bacterium]|nr:hypothetical protein [Kiritimatiellia bacterium]
MNADKLDKYADKVKPGPLSELFGFGAVVPHPELDYAIAKELCNANIAALPPGKVAAAIRARKTIYNASAGSASVMEKVYDRAAELLDVMADIANASLKSIVVDSPG